MGNTVFTLVIALGSLLQAAYGNDFDEVRAQLKELSTATGDNNTEGLTQIRLKIAGVIETTAKGQLESLLVLSQGCVQSNSLRAQVLGLEVMRLVTTRIDGPELLAPYLDLLAMFLNSTIEPTRGLATEALARSRSPKAWAYLATHLGDKVNSAEELVTMGAPLVESGNASYAQKVVSVVEQRPELSLKGRSLDLKISVIHLFGLYGNSNADGLKLVDAGLGDGDPNVRNASLEAVARFPKQTRSRFLPALQRLSSVDEVPEIRSRALAVLISSEP